MGPSDVDLSRKANQLRMDTLKLCVRAGTGHVTSCMSCAEIMAVLYFSGLMAHDPANPNWDERDRFILSKGQASPILYAALADRGFFPRTWLDRFVRGDDGHGRNAPFGVHLQSTVPGVEFTTGSLGHGLGYAAGVAKAAKLDGKNRFTFVLLGDAELYEGSNWEVAMFAAHHQLSHLIAIVDRNRMGTNGYTETINGLEPLDEKFRAFGWSAVHVDGHAVDSLQHAVALAKDTAATSQRPHVIIAATTKGRGIKSMTDTLYLHGTAPEGDKAVRAVAELESFIAEQELTLTR